MVLAIVWEAEFMFNQARVKLTIWYLLIIMLVSTVFSLAVYRNSTFELRRGLGIQALRFLPRPQREERLRQSTESAWLFEGGFFGFDQKPALPPVNDIEIYEEVKRRLALNLALVNLIILFISGAAAYFLAGQTLKPIEKMLEDQKRFVADASHELRTPLTTLKTETEVALRDRRLDLNLARRLLQSNLEEINKMESLSNYLLTLSRYESPNFKPDLQKIEINSLVEMALARVKSLMERKQIVLKKDLTEIKLEGDEVGLLELLTILLDNAIKYSYPGGQVVIKTRTDKEGVTIAVSDFGIGIKASDLPYIFNRFYRADTSRTKVQVGGYGLGLAIAKSIVVKQGGRLSAQSDPTQGTTFTVVLPRR